MDETNIINCAIEFLGPNKWPSVDYTSWNNPENSFANFQSYPPLILDHIFLRTNSPRNVQARTSAFAVTKLKTACNITNNQSTDQCPTFFETLLALNLTQCLSNAKPERSLFSTDLNAVRRRSRTNCDSQSRISLSDHEAIIATIRIRKSGRNAYESEINSTF